MRHTRKNGIEETELQHLLDPKISIMEGSDGQKL